MELHLIDVLLIQKCMQNKIKRTVICYKFNMKIPIKKPRCLHPKLPNTTPLAVKADRCCILECFFLPDSRVRVKPQSY